MEVPEIDVVELARRCQSPEETILLDVRELDELEEARVPGVVHMPLAEVAERLDDIPSAGTVHVICRTGGRSYQAAEFLTGQGRDAVNIAGGTLAWLEAGYHAESGPLN